MLSLKDPFKQCLQKANIQAFMKSENTSIASPLNTAKVEDSDIFIIYLTY